MNTQSYPFREWNRVHARHCYGQATRYTHQNDATTKQTVDALNHQQRMVNSALVIDTLNFSLTNFWARFILPFTNIATVEHHTFYLRALVRISSKMQNSETLSSHSTSSRSLMQGLYEAAASTPPPSSRSSICAPTIDDNDEETRLSIQLVETRLLELVDQQNELASRSNSPTVDSPLEKLPESVLPIHMAHAYPCADTYKSLPVPPDRWPQAPLMLRPTPGSNMRIRGIRYAGSKEYQTFPGVCEGCILPINNGSEQPGKSYVIDFESPLFVGTLLMRVAGAKAIEKKIVKQETSYFDGKKRKFQVLVKGRFKKAIPMSETFTGQVFDRAAGKLPARLLVNAFIKFVSVLAPQLEAKLDGDRPRFLTPLVATAHTVQAHDYETVETGTCVSCSTKDKDNLANFSVYAGSDCMEEYTEEPPSDHSSSVMGLVDGASTAPGDDSSLAERRQARKNAYNLVAATHASKPFFDTSQEYTFEFYQHLLVLTDPDDLKIDMGLQKVGLARSLAGQPIRIMSTHKTDSTDLLRQVLWSFDLWHTALYQYAQKATSRKK